MKRVWLEECKQFFDDVFVCAHKLWTIYFDCNKIQKFNENPFTRIFGLRADRIHGVCVCKIEIDLTHNEKKNNTHIRISNIMMFAPIPIESLNIEIRSFFHLLLSRFSLSQFAREKNSILFDHRFCTLILFPGQYLRFSLHCKHWFTEKATTTKKGINLKLTMANYGSKMPIHCNQQTSRHIISHTKPSSMPMPIESISPLCRFKSFHLHLGFIWRQQKSAEKRIRVYYGCNSSVSACFFAAPLQVWFRFL